MSNEAQYKIEAYHESCLAIIMCDGDTLIGFCLALVTQVLVPHSHGQ